MKQLIGTGVALVTPFNKDFSVDVEGLRRVVRYQIDNGIDYLVVLGTTGESAVLSTAQKQLVIDTVVSENAGALPLVLGIGGNHTQAVVEEITSRDLSAFTAILSVSPMYNKPSQEGIYQHFATIAKASTTPIILYNVPGRTASNMLPDTVARLANDFDTIVAIKEAAGDLVQAMQLIKETPQDFLVISGDDMITLPMVLAGGAGVISVIGQGFPQQFSNMVRLGLDRKVDEAYKIHYNIMAAIDYIFAEGNPAGIKHILQMKDLCNERVKLPLVGISEALKSKMNDFVASFS